MKVFITGASGYIGGAVAHRLQRAGYHVSGLARTEESGELLRAKGVEPVIGKLSDLPVLAQAAKHADAVINTADADDRVSAQVLSEALHGSGKPFIHTSGSGIVGDLAQGEPSDKVFDETTPLSPLPQMQNRHTIDNLVLAAADRSVRSVVLRPGLIYGRSSGLRPHSFQVPTLIDQARRSGVPRYIGRGLNTWSHLHIDDLAELYLLVLEHASPGSLYYAENGEADMATAVGSITRMLKLTAQPEGWPIERAVQEWGPRAHVALGSNSRVRADKARRELHWQPASKPLIDEIESGSYAEDFPLQPAS